MLAIPEPLHRVLSHVWVHRGRPPALIDQAVLDAVEAAISGTLPATFLAYVCATADDPSATLEALARSHAERSADDADSDADSDRDHIPDGYAPLLGLATDERHGYRMELCFALGTGADEVVAWRWKGAPGLDVFDVHFDRYDAPDWSQGSFEHLVWWRYGDRERLLPEDAGDADRRSLREASQLNHNPRLDLHQPADPGFAPQVREGVRMPAAAIRVHHPKFGPGVILRLLPGDKIVVKFDADPASRTLLRRFVTETHD